MIFNALASMSGRSAEGQPSPANGAEAAYLHVPFCRHRCGYCSFTLVAGREDLVERYLPAVDRELELLNGPHPVKTLYFGGGTPSYLTHDQFQRLAEIARRHFPLLPDGEWTIEANPSDIDVSLVNLWADLGVTRLSLGAQSFDAAKLKRLERDHSAATIRDAVEAARRRISNISLDLIFAVPDETLAVWMADLRETLKLEPEHVSTYGLTYERGARFWGRRERGELIPAEEELERRMYEEAIEQLMGAGLEHYEVSNFARPGWRCRHNEIYWSGASYFAAGPGAASYVGGERRMNHGSTTTYLQRVLAGESPIQHRERLSPLQRACEYLVFGLRRMDGVRRLDFQQHTGWELDPLMGSELQRFQELGLLEDDGRTIRLTRRGLMVSDAIWPYLLAPGESGASPSDPAIAVPTPNLHEQGMPRRSDG